MTTTIRQLIGKLSLLCAASALAATAPARAGPAYGAPQTLDRPGWAQTQLWDVNDGRQVVGTSISADGSISAGFVLNNGSSPTSDLRARSTAGPRASPTAV